MEGSIHKSANSFLASTGFKERSDVQGGGRFLCFPVKRRDQATLDAAISQWVRPFTTIYTDRWAAYNHVADIPGRAYNHVAINHNRYFVHPATGTNTNHVEACWAILHQW